VDIALLGVPVSSVPQQPKWDDAAEVERVRERLMASPGLVDASHVHRLRSTLARVAAGDAHVVQAGDCAEDPAECTSGYVAGKAGLLDVLAGILKMKTHRPVVRVARIAGQFAKPRSAPTEWVGGVELPVYRGHMVNSPEPDPVGRRPDPWRMLSGYQAASEVVDRLGWRTAAKSPIEPLVWTSHEALLLDYEISMLRRDEQGGLLLSSTHWPWIGDRTRQVDGAHVRLLSKVVNPVACKVGPTITVDELLALCERLDPKREPGRLSLIARMGADAVCDLLPPLVAAVRAAGHPVIWLCDPMHGNTVRTPQGFKTRFVETLARELQGFQSAVSASGGVAGGLCMETTPDDVTECVLNESAVDQVGEKYTTLCDPRLNPKQAVYLAQAWRGSRAEPEARELTRSKGMDVMGIPSIAPYPLPTAADLPGNIAQWTVDADRAVLLIHDMQRYFLRPFPETVRKQLVGNTVLLRDRCRELGVPVAYTAQPGGMTDEQRGLLKDFWGAGMRVDPVDREIVEPLAPDSSDWMLTKWRYSAFFRSDLLERMRAQGRDQLIVCGVYAHVGVLMSAVEAFTNDIQTFMVADAIADFSEKYHRLALEYAAQRCAVVVTAKEVLP
jgi:3-deoxy-7-phosphoheptulonate synthase